MRLSIALCSLACLLTAGQKVVPFDTFGYNYNYDVTYHGPQGLHYKVLAQSKNVTFAALTDKNDWHTLGNYLLQKIETGEKHQGTQCARLECFVEMCVDSGAYNAKANYLQPTALSLVIKSHTWINAPKSVFATTHNKDTLAGPVWPKQAPWNGGRCTDGFINFKARIYVDKDRTHIQDSFFDFESVNVPQFGSWKGRCAHNKKVNC